MPAGKNLVILVGNLGADPDLNYTPSGASVCNFSLAVNESWKDREGNKQERVEWIRVVAWNKLGELCAKYLAKGRSVLVEGKMRTRSWETDSGERRYATEIVAGEVQFLSGGNGNSSEGGAPPRDPGPDPGLDPDGLPF